MKRFLLLTSLFSICLLGIQQDAHAQFFKKLFHHEKKKKQPEKKPEVVKPKPKPVKKEKIDYPETIKKEKYRIDILAPLYLDELVKENKPVFHDRVPDKALAGVEFYKGIKLAADTLSNLGLIDVFVHDITDHTLSLPQLISNKLLDSSDLIIGLVQPSQIAEVARYARQRSINFISVLAPVDGGVTDNPYFTLVQPSLYTHCRWLRKKISKDYDHKKVFVYHRSTVPVDENAWKTLTDDGDKDFKDISCNALPAKSILLSQFDSTDVNVVVMPILDVNYAESLIKQLADEFPGYRFEIFGMPSWQNMLLVRKAELPEKFVVHYTVPYYFDHSSKEYEAIAAAYKKQFGGRTDEWVFRGYETLSWYASLLRKYGTIFNQKMDDNGESIFTKYEIKPRWTSDHNLLYNENRHVYMFTYKNGELKVED